MKIKRRSKMIGSRGEMKVFSGTSNLQLAKKICEYMRVPLANVEISRFSDGETKVSIGETVRGYEVFVIQSTSSPVNDNLMQLLIMIDAFKRASSASIAVVVPYYGYARQDRKARGRDPISAKLVANLLVAAGADRILTMDLHAPQIQGFFDIPLDNLQGFPVFVNYFKQLNCCADEWIVVSPDVGGVKRARKFAEKLSLDLAILDKRRPVDNVAEVVNIIGHVKGKNAIIVDDIIDTGGSILEAERILKGHGVKAVYVCATHAILSGDAKRKLSASSIDKVVITDTIHQDSLPDKFVALSVANIFGEAMLRIQKNLSVSALFK